MLSIAKDVRADKFALLKRTPVAIKTGGQLPVGEAVAKATRLLGSERRSRVLCGIRGIGIRGRAESVAESVNGKFYAIA